MNILIASENPVGSCFGLVLIVIVLGFIIAVCNKRFSGVKAEYEEMVGYGVEIVDFGQSDKNLNLTAAIQGNTDALRDRYPCATHQAKWPS